MPVYIEGTAIITSEHHSIDQREKSTIVIVFPPEYLNSVQAGQELFLQSDPAGDRIQSSITHVESQISHPADLQQRFNLNKSAVLALPNPSAVAIASFSVVANSSPILSDSGALYRVDIEVGARRLGSLLPIIGQWLDGTP
jgi:hypothetical protein